MRAAWTLSGLLACGCAFAGTVEVVVRDDNGSAVADQPVVLHPALAPGRTIASVPFTQIRRATTGRDGVARFDGLPPGPYGVSIPAGRPGFVPPRENPRAPGPTATLEGERGVVRLDVELWHGTPVVCRADVNRGRLEWVRVRSREIDHGFELDRRFRVGVDDDRARAPGRWELALEPPEGYLLLDVEVDGRSIAGHLAELELEPYGPPRFVTWILTAPASISGHVSFEGPRVGTVVVARLLEPGPWIEAARRRGGVNVETVHAVPNKIGEYGMDLPDGRWEMTVVGDDVVSVEPEVAEVVVQPGEERGGMDFRVSGEESARGRLVVSVRDARGERVADATVEVHALEAGSRGEEPLARGRTRRFGTAFLRGLEPGDYVVAAGHPDHVEGSTELPDHDPEDPNGSRVEVTLVAAATLHAVASDPDGDAVEGVSLRLERTDEPPDMLISDPELVAAASRSVGTTDRTGHAWLEGLWPGSYELGGEIAGDDHRFVRFVDGDRLREHLRLTFAGSEEREVELTVLPAASFAMRLVCADGQELSGAATAVAVPGRVALDELEGESWQSEAVLKREDVPLEGRARDRLEFGPLERGDYYLAVRQTGHERWTWALGTERTDEAALLEALRDEVVDLGTLELDCGPAIRVVPTLHDGERLPDMREVTPARGRLTLEGRIEKDGESRAVTRATVDAYRDELVLRGLDEGEATLDVGLSHPYFVPRTVKATIRAKLERGGATVARPVVPAVGGAILVETAGAVAARAVDASGEITRVETEISGAVSLENLPAGTYDVAVCADGECASVLHSWSHVDVIALRTTRLTLPGP